MTTELIVICPHCQEPVIIQEFNCCIFRHAIYKNTLLQICPHSSKDVCDDLLQKGEIYGCGKPFMIINVNGLFETIICDYI
jgi:hypothetical protein